MITLIIGEPHSGKSALAEQLAMEAVHQNSGAAYYLATMEVLGKEAMERVKKHRALRAGKGFVTIEKTVHVSDALALIRQPETATVLLECVSNLVGNEMHGSPEKMELAASDPACFADAIADDILKLAVVSNLILVTNDFANEGDFDEETRCYVRLCDAVNERLRARADRVEDVRTLSGKKDGPDWKGGDV